MKEAFINRVREFLVFIIFILIFLFFLNENNSKITNLKNSFDYVHYKNKTILNSEIFKFSVNYVHCKNQNNTKIL